MRVVSPAQPELGELVPGAPLLPARPAEPARSKGLLAALRVKRLHRVWLLSLGNLWGPGSWHPRRRRRRGRREWLLCDPSKGGLPSQRHRRCEYKRNATPHGEHGPSQQKGPGDQPSHQTEDEKPDPFTPSPIKRSKVFLCPARVLRGNPSGHVVVDTVVPRRDDDFPVGRHDAGHSIARAKGSRSLRGRERCAGSRSRSGRSDWLRTGDRSGPSPRRSRGSESGCVCGAGRGRR